MSPLGNGYSGSDCNLYTASLSAMPSMALHHHLAALGGFANRTNSLPPISETH
jgi:hypothetical protein